MFISEQMSLTRELDIEYMSVSIGIFLPYCLYQIAGIIEKRIVNKGLIFTCGPFSGPFV